MATLRVEKLAKKVLHDNVGVSKAMIAVGYAPSSARTPQRVTKTKGFQELMQKYLPDKHLQEKHREFLDAPRQIRTYKKGDMVSETIETDPSAVRALDMAYKLKGRYSSEEVNKTLIINISAESANRYGVTPIHEHSTVVHEQAQVQKDVKIDRA
jgi:hypothetical protein